MPWTNVFDLAEWDIYISYRGITSSPDPNSVDGFVRAEDLDPAVGSVYVIDGVVVCNMEDESGAGGFQPAIVLMPKGFPPETAEARVTATRNVEPLVAETADCGTTSVSQMLPQGNGVYMPEAGSVDMSYIEQGEPVTNVVYAGPIPSGEGLAFVNMRPGA